MGYKTNETVGIIAQNWGPHLPENTKPTFERSMQLCRTIHDAYREAGIPTSLLEYMPSEARHGVDAPREVYFHFGIGEMTSIISDIVFMPTAFSLSHTAFRKALTQKGTRIASMPTFTLEMFGEDGPMNADYTQIQENCHKIKESMATASTDYVLITGKKTRMVIQIDKDLIHESSGMLTNRGDFGNLPGAEVYVVPVHLGNSSGYFTVPKNWGGSSPLEHELTFYVEGGRIKSVLGETFEAQQYAIEKVNPNIFDQPEFDVLAELGIGANPKVTPEYIAKYGWSPLLAEKIVDSAHFANGNSFGMGGKNNVSVHTDWVVPDVKIFFGYNPK